MPAAIRKATVAGTSWKDDSRRARSSIAVKAPPKPVEPRTFGANTVMPTAASDWIRMENAGRSWLSGPPCSSTTVGPGSVTPLGRYSSPCRANPSSDR